MAKCTKWVRELFADAAVCWKTKDMEIQCIGPGIVKAFGLRDLQATSSATTYMSIL